MTTIIFTKDRPMQLECLLRSIRENTDFGLAVVIGSKRSDVDYDTNGVKVFLVDEGDFKITFEFALGRYQDDYYCLLCDDDIVFRKPVFKIERGVIYSLRLHPGIKNPIHFDYKGSVDGNIFPASILNQVRGFEYDNPNDLEKRLVNICRPHKMVWGDKPSVIGIPANRVSEGSHCNYMYDNINELKKLYTEGWRIDYKAMDLECDDVHKYIDYKFC